MEQNRHAKVGCVLMAAGNASRFNANKLLMDYAGKPLIRHAMESAAAECIDAVTVVTQYDVIEQMAGDMGFACVRNDHPEWGASYTVRLGTAALQDCDAILYMVSDQPRLTRASVRKTVDAWREAPTYIIAPASGERTGNPCVFPKAMFPELMALEGDVGGKKVIRRHPELLRTVQIEEAELFDCDTPQALEELKRAGK